jgi:hypothetical protein
MGTQHVTIPDIVRKPILVIAKIIVAIFSILVLTIVLFIAFKSMRDWQVRPLEKKTFNNYKIFSEKIMPSNFTLIESQELPGSIDTSYQLVQTFRVSSTRKGVIDQLQPIFQKYDFRTVDLYTTTESATNSQVVYYHDNWSLTNDKTGIWINFFPADPPQRPAQFPDFSVVRFRSKFMLVSEKNRMKVLKIQWLRIMPYPPECLAGAISRGQTLVPEVQTPLQ